MLWLVVGLVVALGWIWAPEDVYATNPDLAWLLGCVPAAAAVGLVWFVFVAMQH